MEAGVCLDKWKYEDVEPEVRAYALRIGSEYQERKPLSFLPPECARTALAHIGVSFRELADLVNYHYQTVVGWFQPGRPLTRTVFAGSLFPVLCEAYVRNCHLGHRHHTHARFDYVKSGDMDESLRLVIERYVAVLLCTGEAMTPEDRQREEAENRRRYHRSLLRFAASYFEDDELEDAAHLVLSLVTRHARRPSQRFAPDEFTNTVEEMRWALWLDMPEEVDLIDRATARPRRHHHKASMQEGAAIISDTADRKRFEDMDLADFRFEKDLVLEYETFHQEEACLVLEDAGIEFLSTTGEIGRELMATLD